MDEDIPDVSGDDDYSEEFNNEPVQPKEKPTERPVEPPAPVVSNSKPNFSSKPTFGGAKNKFAAKPAGGLGAPAASRFTQEDQPPASRFA